MLTDSSILFFYRAGLVAEVWEAKSCQYWYWPSDSRWWRWPVSSDYSHPAETTRVWWRYPSLRPDSAHEKGWPGWTRSQSDGIISTESDRILESQRNENIERIWLLQERQLAGRPDRSGSRSGIYSRVEIVLHFMRNRSVGLLVLEQ